MNSNDLANVMGSFIETELNSFEELNKELEEKDKEIERLQNIINSLKEDLCKTQEHLNNKMMEELKGDSSN